MLDERRQKRADAVRAGRALAGLGPRLRLFGLLALLIPLFAGLQYLVYESVPRVEIRVITTDQPVAEPVEVPTERVVERIVYVPVETTADAVPLNEAGTRLPPAPVREVQSPGSARLGGHDAARAAPIQAASIDAVPERPAIGSAEPEPDAAANSGAGLIEHMGLVALATPAPTPVVVTRPPVIAAAPVIRYVPAPVEESEDEAAVEDAETDEIAMDEPVAKIPDAADDGEAVAQIQVIETTIEADQSTRVVLYRVPARPEADRAPAEPESAAPAPDDEPALADAPDGAAPDNSDEVVAADDDGLVTPSTEDAEKIFQPSDEAAAPVELEIDVETDQ